MKKNDKLVLAIFFIFAFIFAMFFNAAAANPATSVDAELRKKIIGLWQMQTKNNDVQFLFKEDKILQVATVSKDTDGMKMSELYYIIKNNLLLTNTITGERWKVFFIKEIKSRAMTLVDLTPFAKNGDITPLLDMIERREIEIVKEKSWEFLRK